MSDIQLDTPVVIIPASDAVTSSSFVVLTTEENYGANSSGRPSFGRASPESVIAEVLLNSDPYHSRVIVAWQGDAYLSVKGKWTDATLFARLKGILEGTLTADSPA